MKRIANIITLAALLAAVSCTKQPKAESQAVETPVRIEAGLVASDAATKGPILTASFPNAAATTTSAGGATYGIFVCKEGTLTTPHKANSWNLRAAHYPDGDPATSDWRYTYVGNLSTGALASSYYDTFSVTERLDDYAKADLYAYAPYMQGAYTRNPQAIPFTMAGTMADQIDLMYAVENLTNANSNLDPLESVLSATFTFRHAFALLDFRFKLRTAGSYYNLSRINVTLNDPESDGITSAKLYSSGTFNAVTGTFGTCVETSSYNVTYPVYNPNSGPAPTNVTSATSEASAYLMLVPTEPEDDELVFRFTFNGQTLQPFSLKKEQLRHGTSGTYGFQSGYRYTFHFTLDNYLYLDGIDIDEGPWGSGSQGPFEI